MARIYPITLEWGFVQEVSLSASNVSTLPARVRWRHCVCINSFLFVAFQSKCGTHVSDVETRPEARPSKPSENHSGDDVPPVRTPKHLLLLSVSSTLITWFAVPPVVLVQIACVPPRLKLNFLSSCLFWLLATSLLYSSCPCASRHGSWV